MTIVSQTMRLSADQMTSYQVNLALMVASSPVQGRDYNVKAVLERRGVVPEQLRHLCGLSGLQLTLADLKLAQCDFTVFTRLERLDLSSNQLEEIESLQLHKLPHLRWLDLRNNQVRFTAFEDRLLKSFLIVGHDFLSSDQNRCEGAGRTARYHSDS